MTALMRHCWQLINILKLFWVYTSAVCSVLVRWFLTAGPSALMWEILLFTCGNSWVFVNETCCQTEQKRQPHTVDDANEHTPPSQTPHRVQFSIVSATLLGGLGEFTLGRSYERNLRETSQRTAESFRIRIQKYSCRRSIVSAHAALITTNELPLTSVVKDCL